MRRYLSVESFCNVLAEGNWCVKNEAFIGRDRQCLIAGCTSSPLHNMCDSGAAAFELVGETYNTVRYILPI